MINKIITDKIIDVFTSNFQTVETLTTGIEVENIIYDKSMERIPVNRCEKFSSEEIKSALIDLNKVTGIAPNISIEPGGQMEYASQPFRDLHEINREWKAYFRNLVQICGENELFPLDLTVEPIYQPDEIGLIDLKKYQLMHDRFNQTGSLGHWMMKNSSSVQINLDYTSLEEAEKIAFAADCIQPFLSVIFANAPFETGVPTKLKNLRTIIWNNTDNTRCGSLFDHQMKGPENMAERYAEYIAKTPVIFALDKLGHPLFYDGLTSELFTELLDNDQLNNEHIMSILRQIFTHVRFKNVVEIRTCDHPPFGYELAPAAFLNGLLRDNIIFEKLLELVSGWSFHDRMDAMEKSLELDLDKKIFDSKTFCYWCEKLLEMSLEGLENRRRQLNIKSEKKYLETFADAFISKGPFSLQIQKSYNDSGKTLKEFLLSRWMKQKEELFS
tara:strand:+ start:47900 stop:49228 length:1329 start_codon:yes stop_codon:yes gene_type:complete